MCSKRALMRLPLPRSWVLGASRRVASNARSLPYSIPLLRLRHAKINTSLSHTHLAPGLRSGVAASMNNVYVRGFASYPEHEVVGLPALSPTMETGTIAEWKKKEGEKINAGDIVCEVETDKATVAFEAQDDGYLARILAQAKSSELKVGDPIMITVESEGSVAAFKDYTVGASSVAAPAPTPAPAAPAPTTTPVPTPTATITAPAVSKPASGKIFASPLARNLAKAKGLDLSTVNGTGPNGRIIASDVKEAVVKPAETVSASATVSAAAPVAAQAVAVGGVYEDFVLGEVSKALAARLAATKQSVPHYYLSVDLNLDKLLQVRGQMNSGLDETEQISLQDFLIKAVAAAMKEVPSANASWMDSFVRQYHQVDVNIVTGVGTGLLLPVVKDAGGKGLKQIADTRRKLEAAAFAGTLDAESAAIGTFSIINLGMYGVKSGASIVLSPQSCALTIGAAELRVVPNDKPGEGEEAYKYSTMVTVTLSCDHRVVDGAVGAAWLAAFKSLVENPMSMLM